jgi:sigma-B regulation protein RsbU (phosphoserine phosphatase)
MVGRASSAAFAGADNSGEISRLEDGSPRPELLAKIQGPDNDSTAWQHNAVFADYLSSRIRDAFRQAVLDPLASISGIASQLVQQGTPGDQAERICETASRIDSSVQDLLDFTLISLGHGLQLRRRRIHLDLLCERVLDAMGRLNPDHRIVFVPERGIEGEWDPDRVAALLSRLVSSAMSCPDRQRTIRVALRGDADVAVIDVFHSGQSLDRAFVPFAVDSVSGRQGNGAGAEGLGLALYLSREIARAHGGRIDVLKNASGGAKLSVTLPRYSS